MRAVTSSQMKRMDAFTLEALGIPELELVRRSGAALFQRLRYTGFRRFGILCGSGNNGADALACAGLLRRAGFETAVILATERRNENCRALLEEEGLGTVLSWQGERETACAALAGCDCILDGIYGTGFRTERENGAADLISFVNSLGAEVRAVDIPSGASGDDGTVSTACIRAGTTYTLAHPKPGLFLYPAAEYCGRVLVLDIGMPPEALEREVPLFEIGWHSLHRGLLRKRAPNAHKGSFGHLLVAGGSTGMAGSVCMAAQAAARSGAGRVTLGCPESIATVAAEKLTEAMTLPLPCDDRGMLTAQAAEPLLRFIESADAVVFGCGLRCGDGQAELLRQVIRCGKPLVLDADALNLLASERDLLYDREGPVILTPHPGEMARLLELPTGEVNARRLDCASLMTGQYGVTTVLKGAGTVAAFDDDTFFINASGNAGMAKGGSGDVLAGMLGAYLAQGYPVKEAVELAVYLHGLAGDRCAERQNLEGFLPTDLIAQLPAL